MRDERVVERIKKLLRLAQAGGTEAEIARLHAEELMERHNIVVVLEDKQTVHVDGVAGVRWKHLLLDAVANATGCQAKTSTRGARVAALRGHRADVEEAAALYRKYELELLVACERYYKDYVYRTIEYDYFEDSSEEEHKRRLLTDKKVAAIWQDAFMDLAAESLRDKLLAKKPPPRERVMEYEPPPPEVTAQVYSAKKEADERVAAEEREQNRLRARRGYATLAEMLGEAEARELLNAATYDGRRAAQFELDTRPRIPVGRRLQEFSTIPKPPVNRFTFLDYE